MINPYRKGILCPSDVPTSYFCTLLTVLAIPAKTMGYPAGYRTVHRQLSPLRGSLYLTYGIGTAWPIID